MSQIFSIDFGLSKRFKTPNSLEHIPFKDKKVLIADPKFASIHNHKGFEQSRRDDLESLAYMIIYFLKGTLPWIEKYEQERITFQNTKCQISVDELCKDLPNEIKKFVLHCQKLKYDQKPDYSYLKKIIKDLFHKEDYDNDYVFDWILIPAKNFMPSVYKSIPIKYNDFDKIFEPRVEDLLIDLKKKEKKKFEDEKKKEEEKRRREEEMKLIELNNRENINLIQSARSPKNKNKKSECKIY